MKRLISKFSWVLVIMLIAIIPAWSQEIAPSGEIEKTIWNYVLDNLVIIVGGIVLIGALVVIYRLSMLLLEVEHVKMLKEKGQSVEVYYSKKGPSWSWEKLINYALSIVPVAKESSIDMGHDYDGIRELDNRLPPWWLGMMYGSLLFAAVYMYHYHWSGNDWSSEQEYMEEMKAGAAVKADYLFKMANAVNENNVDALTSAEDLAAGKDLWIRNCVACHGPEGQGGVGPNMTDDYWIHGSSIKDVFRTIKYGVPEKGMIAWQTQLRPQSMQQLSSYILTLVGTNPPNPKAPEGELSKE